MLSICYEACKKCNLRCEYCISSDNVKTDGDSKNYKEIISNIGKLNPQRVVVSGGEPLLDTELIEKLIYLRRKCPSAFISLSTNGSIEYDLETLTELIDCIDISLPALSESTYKKMRGVNCVEKVIKNIKKAKEYGINTRISFVLTKVNDKELFSVLDFSEQAGIDSVRIGRYLPFRNAEKCRKKFELSPENIEEIMSEVKARKYSYEIIPPIQKLQSMETSYLNVDFNGKFFLPTQEGKVYLESDLQNGLLESKIGNQLNIFKKIQLNDKYERFFRPLRTRESESRSLVDEFYSDRTRILFSANFRRLQQKAQVFSLEKNPSVRSRLTHSIEVSDVGRRLAFRISKKLSEKTEYRLDTKYIECLSAIVENACLLHDIGNPPFGHFGEAAIRKWWMLNHESYIQKYNERAEKNSKRKIQFSMKESKDLLKDFEEFDGNPQGIRTILRLSASKDDLGIEMQSGLNLSYPTILCGVKYICVAGEKRENGNKDITKKAGYFQSEKNILNKIYEDMGLMPERMRYPFTYIMEAADDIAYGMSDIADGIEKRVFSLERFINIFEKTWKEKYGEISEVILPNEVKETIKDHKALLKKDFNNLLGAYWKTLLINDVVEEYIEHIEDYLNGNASAIISDDKRESYRILHILKIIARKYIYRAPEAEEIEMSGYSIISGLLEYFGSLLELTNEEFASLVNGIPLNQDLNLEWRIFNRLGETCVLSYRVQLQELKKYFTNIDEDSLEWWLRVHLIIDHIAGMTDDYALKTYQVCKGIEIGTF